MKATLLLAVCLAAAFPVTAFAQAAPLAEPGVTAGDCQVDPVPEGDKAEAPAPPDDLTAKLDKCNGVLQPPPTGDTEIREPAPEGGETPVIPPGALPEQPPSEG